MAIETSPAQVSYGDLARLFLRLSLTAFGGPVAHIALGEDEIVTRRKWITREHYLDLVAATNLIPGPNSTEVMIHVGYVTRGIPGAVLAGVCFIGPAFLLTLALAVLYVSTGSIPQVEAILWGIKPVIVAIIAQVAYRLMQAALKNRLLWGLMLGVVVLLLLTDIPEVVMMVGVGVAYAVYQSGFGGTAVGLAGFLPASWMSFKSEATQAVFAVAQVAQGTQAVVVSLWDIFFYFLKIGSVLFGSGYVLISYIQQDVVNTFGWLSTRQLLDAVAIGQVTPGPVSTTTAVVGYIIAGLPGALAATVGIFLPSFVLVILTAPLIPKMRKSPFLSAFLEGANAGVIAAILVTLIGLAGAALRTVDGTAWSPAAIGLALASLGLLIRYKVNATWLIVAGGGIGLIAGLIGMV